MTFILWHLRQSSSGQQTLSYSTIVWCVRQRVRAGAGRLQCLSRECSESACERSSAANETEIPADLRPPEPVTTSDTASSFPRQTENPQKSSRLHNPKLVVHADMLLLRHLLRLLRWTNL